MSRKTRDTPSLVVENSSLTRVSSPSRDYLERLSRLSRVPLEIISRGSREALERLSRLSRVPLEILSSFSRVSGISSLSWFYLAAINIFLYVLRAYYLIQKSYTEDWRAVVHLVLYCDDNSLKREFVFVPSMCESAGQYFEAPEPTIESFLAEPCSALEVV
jgi:hypothetical protein